MPKRNQETREQSFARNILIHQYEGRPEIQDEIEKKLNRLSGTRKEVKKTLSKVKASKGDRAIGDYQNRQKD